MNRSIFVTTCTALFWAGAVSWAPAQPGPGPTADPNVEIRKVLQTQQEAWNRGDIEGFMNGYARLDSIVFVSGDDVTRGWETVHQRYKTKYSDRAKMGSLTFSDLEIPLLGSDSAVVLGRWQLDRKEDRPHGRFTLVLRRTTDGWRIVYDHTSTATTSP